MLNSNEELILWIKKLFEEKKYKFFSNGKYNLNIIGVRSPDHSPNCFDDTLLCIYKKYDNQWEIKKYKITTDPGLPYLLKPINKNGTAILAPGQYAGAYKIGYHRGIYKALVQSKPVKVFRDNNKDSVLDFDAVITETGNFGINIHRAFYQGTTPFVDKHSAGCQVFQNASDFNEFMNLCEVQSEMFSNSFTYTLIEGTIL